MSCLGTHADIRDYEMEMHFSFHSQAPNTEIWTIRKNFLWANDSKMTSTPKSKWDTLDSLFPFMWLILNHQLWVTLPSTQYKWAEDWRERPHLLAMLRYPIHLLGWPKNLFSFFCSILWKIQTNFLVNPINIQRICDGCIWSWESNQPPYDPQVSWEWLSSR